MRTIALVPRTTAPTPAAAWPLNLLMIHQKTTSTRNYSRVHYYRTNDSYSFYHFLLDETYRPIFNQLSIEKFSIFGDVNSVLKSEANGFEM